jgi:hypothetical protein
MNDPQKRVNVGSFFGTMAAAQESSCAPRLGSSHGTMTRAARRMPRPAALALIVLTVGSLTPLTGSSASAQSSVPLVGTFWIAGGACNPVTKAVSGSYFRLIFPKGNVHTGFFFQNSTSPCFDKSYTTIFPGTQGGPVTGTFQPGPTRAFARNGDARARAIMLPVPFAGIDLTLSTQSIDPQTRQAVPAPTIRVTGGRISGNLEAVSAAWKNIYINQGSPKPGGLRLGLTVPVSGRYNTRARAFVMDWTSQIVGGPFTRFIGQWHLVGKFVPNR